MDTLLRRRSMIVAGGEPPAPVFYDRLVFDGTAYIDTDIVLTGQNSLRVSLGNETLKAAQAICSCQTTNGRIMMNYGSNTSATKRNINIWYDGAGTASLGSGDVGFSVSRFSVALTPSMFMYYTENKSFSGAGNGVGSGPLTIGNTYTHGSQSYTGQMGIFYIYGADAKNVTLQSQFNSFTPVYTLRPCTYNGEAGIWCVETSRFYGNSAASGALSVVNNS